MLPLHARDGSVRAWAILDAADYRRLGRYRWCLHSAGYAYRGAWVAGKQHTRYLHRDVLGLTDPALEADHINRRRLDCRRSNLRLVSHAKNLQNVSLASNNRSGCRGVSWAKRQRRWRADVRLNGRNTYLGLFKDRADACRAAAAWRAEHHPCSDDARMVAS